MSEQPMPCVIYAAKSTEDKHGSIPTQLEDCRAMAEREGWTVVGEHKDEAFSAYSGDRGPGLAATVVECERLAAEHGEAVLIVQHSDRLARGDGRAAKHLVEYALWAGKNGVRLVSVQDPEMFTEGEMALLFSTIGGMRNHQDSKRKGASVKSGMRRRAERGLHNGGKRPFGYTWEPYLDSDGTLKRPLTVCEPEAVIVRRIFDECIAGRGRRQTARDLNADRVPTQSGRGAWHQASVGWILANPLYAGRVRLNGEVYEGQHEPIIDPETWEKAAQVRAAAKTSPGKGRGRQPSGPHLFTKGLLKCGRCGAAMTPITQPRKTTGQYEVYACSGHLEGSRACDQPRIRRELIDSAVLRFFEDVALDVDATRTAIENAHQAKIREFDALRDQAQRDLVRAEERLARVRRDYQDGRLDADDWHEQRIELGAELYAATAQGEALDGQRVALEAEVAQIDTEGAVLAELAAIRAMVAGDVTAGGHAGIDEVRVALRRLFTQFELIDPHVSGLGKGGAGLPWSRESPTIDQDGRGYVLLPYVRDEALRWDAAEFPALKRAALTLRDNGAIPYPYQPTASPARSVHVDP